MNSTNSCKMAMVILCQGQYLIDLFGRCHHEYGFKKKLISLNLFIFFFPCFFFFFYVVFVTSSNFASSCSAINESLTLASIITGPSMPLIGGLGTHMNWTLFFFTVTFILSLTRMLSRMLPENKKIYLYEFKKMYSVEKYFVEIIV